MGGPVPTTEPNTHFNFCLKCLLPDRLLHCEKPRCRNAMHIDCAGLKVPCCALCECSW